MMRTIFTVIATAGLGFAAILQAADEVVSLDGRFGSFISLNATLQDIRALGPDRVEAAVSEDERALSAWHYFSARGIRVRVCADNQRVETVNATVAATTQKYVTEAGVRIGDSLNQTTAAYGDRLQVMPETGNAIWFVHDDTNNHRLTFGFGPDGSMRWVALGALRENGWTCGQQSE